MPPRKVLAFGEVLWDVLPDRTVLGGATANFAYRVNSLGDSAVLVSRLGRDDLGRRAWDRLGELGMDRGRIQWDDRLPTGTVDVTVDSAGNPDFVIHRDVAYDAIEATDDLLSAAGDADCLCFGTLIQRATPSRETLERVLEATRPLEDARGCLKVLDINLRKECFSEETVRFSLGRADVLKLNDAEARQLADMLGLRWRSLPRTVERLVEAFALRACVVTLGGRGAFAASAEGDVVHVPGHEVRTVDSCGSGDAFTAGFVRLYLRRRPLVDCCRLGNALGALVATRAGATDPISPREISDFLASGSRRVADPEIEELVAAEDAPLVWTE